MAHRQFQEYHIDIVQMDKSGPGNRNDQNLNTTNRSNARSSNNEKITITTEITILEMITMSTRHKISKQVLLIKNLKTE